MGCCTGPPDRTPTRKPASRQAWRMLLGRFNPGEMVRTPQLMASQLRARELEILCGSRFVMLHLALRNESRINCKLNLVYSVLHIQSYELAATPIPFKIAVFPIAFCLLWFSVFGCH